MDFMPAKKLGFGLMRMPLNDTHNDADVDIEQVCKMVDLFLERGFTYFDTALMYHSCQSESVVKKALVDRHPRESFTLATKLHSSFFNSIEERDKVFEQQLEKTGAGYFDYYLIHGIEGEMLEKYERLDCFGFALQKKKEGLIKHVGFSFHDTPELLDRILTDHPEMEFVQLQINYMDWDSEWIHSRACYEVALKHNKPVIVMEPVKGGTLANKMPDAAVKLFTDHDASMSIPSWAIRFVASLDNVMMVLSGMSSLEQIEDNTGFMQDFVPLSEEEKNLCLKAGEIINSQIAIPCTACSYCTGGCPMNICIPKYFSLYNADMRDDLERKGWTINFSTYNTLGQSFGKASACVACGQCEGVCPQHLPIIDNLKKVAALYEH